MVLYSLFIILSMLFRPQGIFGRYEITDLARWLRRKVGPGGGGRSDVQTELRRTPGLAGAEDEPTPGPATLAAEYDAAPIEDQKRKIEDPLPLLEIRGLTMQFGGLRAVDDFSLTLLPGELVGLIGLMGRARRRCSMC